MLQKILQYVVWFFIRCLMATYRTEIIGAEKRERARELSPDKSLIFVLWHENVVSCMVAHAWTEPFALLSSRSKDGDFAAFITEKMGYKAVRGSSKKRNKDKGGKEAIATFVENLKAGNGVGLTVDGPKGPRQVCKVGAALISQQTGAAILPMVGVASSYWEFNSWDRFKLPKPFAKLTVIYADSVIVPVEATPEEVNAYCLQIGESMKKVAADFK